MSKLYIVTGGAGFVGSHLVAALIARGDRVRILDNLSTGKPENVPPEAELIQESITDLKKITPHFVGVDGVFHMAALPQVQTSIENPLNTHEVNISGTLNVILAASEAGVKRLVYSASSAAYGDQDVSSLNENIQPKPMSPYGLQKYVGEHYARLAYIFWKLESISLRYFNVYGPRMAFSGAYNSVIATFLQQKLHKKPLTITGDGKQTRDFIYVDDVVAANLLAMESHSVGNGEVVNIGSAENHSVNQVAEIIGGPIVHISPRIEPHDTLADIQRAKKLLGWTPKIDFQTGMAKTIAWFTSVSSPK